VSAVIDYRYTHGEKVISTRSGRTYIFIGQDTGEPFVPIWDEVANWTSNVDVHRLTIYPARGYPSTTRADGDT